jgi:hypothetical protein
MFVLIAIFEDKDLWFIGFRSQVECEAYALISKFDWWACIPTGGGV